MRPFQIALAACIASPAPAAEPAKKDEPMLEQESQSMERPKP
jgi:hypothetical protein